jgi:hypothetical protein
MYGCERYPDCDFAVNHPPIGDHPCPECRSLLVRRPKSIRCWGCGAELDDGFNVTKPGDPEAEAEARAAKAAARAARAAAKKKRTTTSKTAAKRTSAKKKTTAKRTTTRKTAAKRAPAKTRATGEANGQASGSVGPGAVAGVPVEGSAVSESPIPES